MVEQAFNIAQEDSIARVRAKFEEKRRTSVDAEIAESRFDSTVRTSMLFDALTAEQLATPTGPTVDDIEASIQRYEARSHREGDGGFSERFAAVYPEKAAEQERKKAISDTRKRAMLQRAHNGGKDSSADE